MFMHTFQRAEPPAMVREGRRTSGGRRVDAAAAVLNGLDR